MNLNSGLMMAALEAPKPKLEQYLPSNTNPDLLRSATCHNNQSSKRGDLCYTSPVNGNCPLRTMKLTDPPLSLSPTDFTPNQPTLDPAANMRMPLFTDCFFYTK